MPDSKLSFGKVDINMTHYLDMLPMTYKFNEMVARLHTIGLSNGVNIFDNGDKYKLTFELAGKYNGQVFTLYDWKCDNEIHVGGHDTLDRKGLISELMELIKETKPTKFTSKYYYDLGSDDEKEYSY